MRNILEYPVTKDELLNYLSELDEECSKKHVPEPVCGDMEGEYIDVLRDLVNKYF